MKRLWQLVSINLVLVGLVGLLSFQPVSALSRTAIGGFADSKSDVCAGIGLTGGSGCGDSGTQVNTAISAAINILSIIVGIAAVVMIIVAGMRFITSGGDSNKVAGARSAILYAIVGLVVVVLSQVIVHFVLSKA